MKSEIEQQRRISTAVREARAIFDEIIDGANRYMAAQDGKAKQMTLAMPTAMETKSLIQAYYADDATTDDDADIRSCGCC